MPRLVIIVEEASDLLLNGGPEVEENILKLTQKSRAVGIHLILATQRPSADIIKGSIKANIPTRFAFKVPTQVDSSVVLDQPGAEKLLGPRRYVTLRKRFDSSPPRRLFKPARN
jgi:DNA segregation ATPase FtsK/SpoIIIE, S-DNA-T family